MKNKGKKLSEKELNQETKFGDTIHVTLQVENGNNSMVQSQMGGMSGLMASLDLSNIEAEQPHPEPEIKIAGYNINELDELIARDEQALRDSLGKKKKLGETQEIIATDELSFQNDQERSQILNKVDKLEDSIECLTSRSERATREDRQILLEEEMLKQEEQNNLVNKLFEEAKMNVNE